MSFISPSTCRRQVEMLGMTKGRVTLPFWWDGPPRLFLLIELDDNKHV